MSKKKNELLHSAHVLDAADLSHLLSYWLGPENTDPVSAFNLSDTELKELIREETDKIPSEKQNKR